MIKKVITTTNEIEEVFSSSSTRIATSVIRIKTNFLLHYFKLHMVVKSKFWFMSDVKFFQLSTNMFIAPSSAKMFLSSAFL